MERQQQYALLMEVGPHPGHKYQLRSVIVTLGRGTDNNIVINDPRISRQHTRIRMTPEHLLVEDLKSINGTWVNDKRINEPTPLEPGDMLRLADTVTFELVAEPISATPPPPTASYTPPPTAVYETVPPPARGGIAPPKRPRAFYVGLAIIVILICLCLAVGVYLWFAPVEFWQQFYDFFGITPPQALLPL